MIIASIQPHKDYEVYILVYLAIIYLFYSFDACQNITFQKKKKRCIPEH